ncbi:hypothetical protein [Streptosporangium sp. NPDC002607]
MDSVGASVTRFEELATALGQVRARESELEAELLTMARHLRGAGVQQRLLGRLLGERAAMKPATALKWLQRHGVEADPTIGAADGQPPAPLPVQAVEAVAPKEPATKPKTLETSVPDVVDDAPGPAAAPAAVPAPPAETTPSPWERYGDPANRRRWYSDDELTAVQLVATGDVDGGSWVIVAGDILGTVRPHLSARGTRSGWEARHRGGGTVYHLSGKGRGSHPATRDTAVAELVADVRHRWAEQRRR